LIYKNENRVKNHIEHQGTVTSVCANVLTVRILASAACKGCAERLRCMPSESHYKDIQVRKFSGDFVSGEQVKVLMPQSAGNIAVLMAYIIPLLTVITVLVTVYQLTKNEFVSGLSALLSLIPYYVVLKFLNYRNNKSINFIVKKLDLTELEKN
jgi:positive regulator of sigma E activity